MLLVTAMSLKAYTSVCALPGPLELDAEWLPSLGVNAAPMLRLPSALKFNAQLGVTVGTLTVQLAAPLVSVTVPAGDPPPGALTLSANVNVVGWLMRPRVGPTTLIAVLAIFTWCCVPTLLLALKSVFDGV